MSDFDIDDIPSFVDENGSDNSPAPESREVLLIQQGIFDYNMNTTVAGVAEDKAMDEAVRYFQALIDAAQKALLDKLQVSTWKDDNTKMNITRHDFWQYIEAERQQFEKDGADK